MESANWIYQTDERNRARFVIGERGRAPLLCIGTNPSTASPGNLDPTMRAVKRFSENHNYNGWIMVNLYPQRATNPNSIHKRRSRALHEQNLAQIRTVLKAYNKTDIWAAWGTLIEKRKFLCRCLRDICSDPLIKDSSWITFGPVTKMGHPRHPLYLPSGAARSEFDIERYLNSFK